MIANNWKCLVMIVIALVLSYLAIVKKFEPLLLLPISFGMLLTNLPGAEMYHEILFAGGHIHWDLIGGATVTQEFLNELASSGVSETVLNSVAVGKSISIGLIDILYLGVKLGIYPCLIFLGVGAMTDFGPLIANPKSLLLGAAAQLGIFITYIGSRPARLYRSGSELHRHHRRCRRPDGHLCHDPPGAPAARTDRGRRLLLHGAGTGHPAADHEAAHNEKRAHDHHEAAASGFQDRKDSLPDCGYHLCCASVPSAAPLVGMPDARQPLA